MIELAIALPIIALSLWMAAVLSRKRTYHIECYKKYSTSFYASAKRLLSVEDVPFVIVELLQFMNFNMREKDSARRFVLSVMTDRGQSNRSTYDEINNYFKGRPGLEDLFEETCHAFMRALSYRSLFFGFIMRRLFLFDDMDSRERPAQLVVQIEKRYEQRIKSERANRDTMEAA